MFMEDLEVSGMSFLVERLEPGREDESARVSREASGLYRFESRQPNIVNVSSLRSIHEFLTQWAFEWERPDDE